MRASVANVLRLCIKELRSLRADPVMLVLIAWAFTFSIVTVSKGMKFEVSQASVALADEDQSVLSGRIATAIQPPYFRQVRQIAVSDIDRSMDLGTSVFVLEIPPRFEADTLAGNHPKIQINVDATAMSQAGNGAVLLQNIIAREVRNYVARSSAVVPPNVGFVTRARYNPNLDAVWFTSTMQVINNITILSIILSGAAVIREREQGTIEHLLVMPVTSFELTLSKILANGSVIIVAALLSLLLVVRLFLGVPLQGSLGWFVIGAILYQFSVMAFGILLATLTASMAQFGLLVIPILMSMLLLSGSITPIESMPAWMQAAMQLVPSTQFVSFAQATLYRAARLDTIWHHLMIIAASGGAFFTLSVFRLHGWVTKSQ